MDLKLKEVAEMLQVSEKTIYRWIKDGKIPYYRINHQYRFHRYEIEKWANLYRNSNNTQIQRTALSEDILSRVTLSRNLKNGGIYYHVTSPDMNTALASAVELINMPSSLNRDFVLEMLIKRESMAPTSAGHGIAFPHPREQIIPDENNESISICFLDTPIVGHALDSEAIHTLIIILSSTPETHLKTLARLSFLCREEKFIDLLRTRARRHEIFSFLDKFEAALPQ